MNNLKEMIRPLGSYLLFYADPNSYDCKGKVRLVGPDVSNIEEGMHIIFDKEKIHSMHELLGVELDNEHKGTVGYMIHEEDVMGIMYFEDEESDQ